MCVCVCERIYILKKIGLHVKPMFIISLRVCPSPIVRNTFFFNLKLSSHNKCAMTALSLNFFLASYMQLQFSIIFIYIYRVHMQVIYIIDFALIFS